MANKDYTALLSANVWPRVEASMLNGIKAGTMRDNLKVVLANTRQALLADTQMQQLVYLPKLVLPLIRRLFPKLIANQIISTQAMTGPTGWIRFLDAYVEYPWDGTGDKPADKNIYPWSAVAADRNYSNAPVSKTLALSSITGSTLVQQGTIEFYQAEGTLTVEMGDAATGSTVWTKIADVDKNGIIVSTSDSPKVLGAVDPKTKAFVVSFVSAPGKEVRFNYSKDFQKNIPFGNEQTYSKMKFDITKVAIEAKSRKLGATYSFELMEDYKNEFGENFEDKMVDYLTTTILTEIDSEIINLLYGNATHTSSWSSKMPATWTRGQNAWYETVMPAINKLSNTIFQQTHVAGASFLVCSPVTATVFQGMMQYQGTGNPVDATMEVSSSKVGTLSNMYNVYISPLCPDNKILMGFKGKTPEETGAVYAPYVPVTLQPIYYSEGMPSILARSRYALKVLRPDYYAVLNVTED
jgi:hypothetical protein